MDQFFFAGFVGDFFSMHFSDSIKYKLDVNKASSGCCF